MEVVILLILIFLNGVFAMSEIALLTARRALLASRAASGSRAADVAMKLGKDPNRFLSTIQIGITSIGLLSGIFGEAALAAPLASWLQDICHLSSHTAGVTSTIIVVAVVTYVSIVIGELVPKRLGQLRPEAAACLVARPMAVLALISRPFVALLAASTRLLLPLFGVNPEKQPSVTEEEIQAMIDEGSESGAIEKKQRELMRNIFRLDDRHAGSIMIPRSDLMYVDIQLSPEENIRRLKENDFSRFPVCDGGLDHILGVIHARQALLLFSENRFSEVGKYIQPPVFIPETLTCLELLKQLHGKNIDFTFIVDEYGDMVGIVTLQDLLEVLVGQLNVTPDDAWAIRREDGAWILDGSISIMDMKDKLAISSLPDEEKGYYNLLSGMIMYIMGRVPQQGDTLEWGGWRFEVVEMEGNRIDKVLAEKPQ